MQILIVDHQDSFTYNLVHDLGKLTGDTPEVVDSKDPQVLRHARRTDLDLLVLSAGPGHPGKPADAGLTPLLLAQVRGQIPVFGVCFGLQLLVSSLGGSVLPAQQVVHGKSVAIFHRGAGLFAGLPRPISMMCYNSLVASRDSLPVMLAVDAANEAGEIMAVRHRSQPLWAVQFHPESVGSPRGMQLLRNLLSACKEEGIAR
jgi:anthranilate synthase/aminodeoxychorismate synthase-like glutamine amidotransferase